MPNPEAILDYWLRELSPKDWYSGGETLDNDIRDRFLGVWQSLANGECESWRCTPEGSLAYILVADQFPRNMFRGQGRSFSTDMMARSAAARAIHRGFDLRIAEPQRQFFYMPMMHSECGTDQDRAVRMMLTRMPETGASNLLHARAHREVIRRFGRFPFRNQALGRETTEAEARFLGGGSYGSVVEALSA